MSAEILRRDEARRQHLTKLNEAQSRRNAASKEIGKAKGAKDEATAARLMQEVAELKTVIQEGEAAERAHDRAVVELLETIPNLPRAEVPDGKEAEDNKEVRRVGTPGQFNFTPKQHFEIGEALGLMDFETAAKMSGARFVVLKGQLAKLERAIAQFMLDIHTAPANGQIGGYTEHQVPYLVKRQRFTERAACRSLRTICFRRWLAANRFENCIDESASARLSVSAGSEEDRRKCNDANDRNAV